jgi:flagellar biogenesis protein FliO
MKLPLLSKLILLLMTMAVLTLPAMAQNKQKAASNTAPAQNAQNSQKAASNTVAPAQPAQVAQATQTTQAGQAGPMAEDEKITFMQQEEAHSTENVSTGGIIFKTLGAMLIVVGLIFFGAWGLKKFGFGNKAGAQADTPELSVVSSVTVGSGRTISSVKFGNRILLVGSTPQSFTLLADGADGADEENFYTASPRSVAELLAAEESFEDELAKADAGLISLFQGGRS